MTGRECIRCGLLIPPKMEWDGATTQRDACPAYDIARCRERVEARATVVRALTAQAWAVACALLDDGCSEQLPAPRAETEPLWLMLANDVGSLPAPADLAAEILGGA